MNLEKIPAWVKVVAGILLFAVLYGAAQLLLYFDKAASGKFGLD